MSATLPRYPVATLPWASSAVTVTESALPAVTLDAADSERCVAAPGVTEMLALPVTDETAVSVTVMVCVPTVFSTVESVKVWVPASPAVNV